jgi:hypothetical protein
MSNGNDSHGIGDALKGAQEMVEHVSMQFVSKKSCPVKVFVYYKT